MDMWTEKVAVVLLILTAAFTITTMRGDVECWTPAHFTQSAMRYTNAICASTASKQYTNTTGLLVDWNEERISPLNYDESPLLRLLIGEILLVLVTYHLTKSFITSTNLDVFAPKGSHKNYIKAPLYILFHIVLVIVWISLAVQTNNILSETEPHVPLFMCDFIVRRLGNMQRYTVQCSNSGFGGSEVGAVMSIGICLVNALVKLLHVIYLFFIQSCGKMKNIAHRLTKMEVIKSTNDISYGFIFSDLYFAIMVHGDKFVQGLGQDGQIELAEME